MARDREKLLSMLQEQMSLLRTSLDYFYLGNFGESLRIATTIRLLVHETKKSKSLLQQLTQDSSKLQILDSGRRLRPGDDEVLRLTLGVRLGPGAGVWPAVDLGSSHYAVNTIGTWWRRIVFKFNSAVGPLVNYKRNEVVLMLANREGGAHVDPNENPDYVRLLKDLPLGFAANGIRVQAPDLARFVTAQAGVEILECLKRNFFPRADVPLKWECGIAPSPAVYLDEISAVGMWISSAFPQAEMHITRR